MVGSRRTSHKPSNRRAHERTPAHTCDADPVFRRRPEVGEVSNVECPYGSVSRRHRTRWPSGVGQPLRDHRAAHPRRRRADHPGQLPDEDINTCEAGPAKHVTIRKAYGTWTMEKNPEQNAPANVTNQSKTSSSRLHSSRRRLSAASLIAKPGPIKNNLECPKSPHLPLEIPHSACLY